MAIRPRSSQHARRGIIGTVLALAALWGIAWILSSSAWWNTGTLQEPSEQERRLLLETALKRGKVAARLEAGDTVEIGEQDVARVAGSRCVVEKECVASRRTRGWTELCRQVQSFFYCAFEVLQPGGKAAVAFVRAYERQSIPPFEIPGEERRWRPSPLGFDAPDTALAQKRLCALGHCEPDAMAGWKQRALEAERRVAAAAEERARPPEGCLGALTVVVGRGKTCIPTGEGLAVREFRDCRDGICGPVMVALPKGRYLRGTSDAGAERLRAEFKDAFFWLPYERPQREVLIDYHFAVSKLEITFDDWDLCVQRGRCSMSSAPQDHGWGRGRRPVVGVSWREIEREYLPWINARLGLSGIAAYRLLTDAEWEYAARAGTTTHFAFGDTIARTEAHYSFGGGHVDRTVEAGSFTPNAFGLHDMHGNAAEWVQDCADASDGHAESPTDGSAVSLRDCRGRIVRGGSWASPAERIRSAARDRATAVERRHMIGFRIARTLPLPR